MFNQNWYSDFLIQYNDGSLTVRELLDKNKINYLKELRKLEFSRRYWKQQNINDWKIVLVSPFTPYSSCKHPFWPFLRKFLKNIFLADHAALLSFCSGGCSFQNEGRRGTAAHGEKVPETTKSANTGIKACMGALVRFSMEIVGGCRRA